MKTTVYDYYTNRALEDPPPGNYGIKPVAQLANGKVVGFIEFGDDPKFIGKYVIMGWMPGWSRERFTVH